MIKIKKYGNRRLYDTASSQYINLQQLADMVKQGEEVCVEDAKTGGDLTHEVLLQVVMEELKGKEIFPTDFLRIIIMSTGDTPWSKTLLDQLTTSMKLVNSQMSQIEKLIGASSWSGFPTEHVSEDTEMDELRVRLAELERKLRS